MRKGNSISNLESLFGARRGESLSSSLRLVERTSILPDPNRPQPRTQFDAGALEELANSMQTLRDRGAGVGATGILQPLLVRLATADEKSLSSREDTSAAIYILLAGERRWRASELAGIERVPVVLSESIDGQSAGDSTLLLQIIENLQRENLAPLDEANAYARLREEQGLSIRELAVLLGKTRGYLTNRLDLLKMDEALRAMVSSREDTLKHAALIASVEDADQRAQLIELVLNEGASVLQLRRILENPDATILEKEALKTSVEPNSGETEQKASFSEALAPKMAPVSYRALIREHLTPAADHLARLHTQLQQAPVPTTEEAARLKKQLAALKKMTGAIEKYLVGLH